MLTYSIFSYWPVPVKALHPAQRRSTDMFAAQVYIIIDISPSHDRDRSTHAL
jgi:hypothetical protein